MGIWDGIEKAEITKRGKYLSAGHKFTLKIKKCDIISTRDKGDAFVVDFDVVDTTDPNHPVGAERNWYQSCTDKNVFQGAVKQFVAAIYGYDLSTMKERFDREVGPSLAAICEAALCKDGKGSNSLAGQVVKVSTVAIKTQKRGMDFTRHDWEPVALRP
jgi:hypothetical protein